MMVRPCAETPSPTLAGRLAPNCEARAVSNEADWSGKPEAWTSDQPRISPSVTPRPPLAPSWPPCSRSFSSADRRSSIEALSLGIDEVRRDDACAHLLVLDRIGTEDLGTFVLQAAIEEAERDILIQLVRPSDRGDIAAAMA